MIVNRRLENNQKFLRWLTIAVFAVIVIRLVTLQLLDTSKYRTEAAMNQFRFFPIRAPRGDIVDSKGTLLASNKIVDAISIVPQQITDSAINNLIVLVQDTYPDIDAPYIQKLLADAAQSGQPYQSVVIKQDVSMDVVERLEEHRQDLPGVQIGKSLVRDYAEGTVASHLLGYIGEISSDELAQHQDENYQSGDLIGKSGLESQYESYLRGRDGFQEMEVDVSGRPVPHANLSTVPPVQGDKLVLTIDNNLQETMDTSMDNTLRMLRGEGYNAVAGAAVALDVKTGAVLAMTSRPNFDPNALVPPVDDATVRKYIDPPAGSASPMINRAISSLYSPGSTFKAITGMAALASGNIDLNFTVDCTGHYWLPPYPACWEVDGITNFFKAVKRSCDVYFYEAGRRAGIELMDNVAHEFGLDQPTGIDLPGEATGDMPSPEKQKTDMDLYWRKWYQDQETTLNNKYAALLATATTAQQKSDLLARQKSAQRSLDEDYRIKYNFATNWQQYETFNTAIGQGDDDFTPIELANYIAQLANNGQRMRPYLVQQIDDPSGKVLARFGPQVAHDASVNAASNAIGNFDQIMATVRQAMAGSTDPDGTSGLLFLNYPVKVAAKTGSAETSSAVNGFFVAFAPVDNPQIAFAGVIETAHHGSDSIGYVGLSVLDQYFGLGSLNIPFAVR
jgi:penicillin-binding protein 2